VAFDPALADPLSRCIIILDRTVAVCAFHPLFAHQECTSGGTPLDPKLDVFLLLAKKLDLFLFQLTYSLRFRFSVAILRFFSPKRQSFSLSAWLQAHQFRF
jgi:hypothetical protein